MLHSRIQAEADSAVSLLLLFCYAVPNHFLFVLSLLHGSSNQSAFTGQDNLTNLITDFASVCPHMCTTQSWEGRRRRSTAITIGKHWWGRKSTLTRGGLCEGPVFPSLYHS